MGLSIRDSPIYCFILFYSWLLAYVLLYPVDYICLLRQFFSRLCRISHHYRRPYNMCIWNTESLQHFPDFRFVTNRHQCIDPCRSNTIGIRCQHHILHCTGAVLDAVCISPVIRYQYDSLRIIESIEVHLLFFGHFFHNLTERMDLFCIQVCILCPLGA